ncbi:MAG: hypothetical protein AAFR93_15920 [Pseudomonadota bacterium]
MRHLLLICALALGAPALAQAQDQPLDQDAPNTPPLWSLDDLLGGLLDQNLRPFLRDFAGALEGLLDEVGDLSAYEMPEVLPNGDIILRRKQDAPPLPQPSMPAPTDPDGSIDL